MHEALLYNKGKPSLSSSARHLPLEKGEKIGGVVNCQLCNHFCHIPENQAGFCGVRKNVDGKLYSLNYNRLIAKNIDPIEKKPLFHFLPGSLTYSIACMGCNFHCLNCQNWQISQLQKVEKLDSRFPGKLIKAEEIIEEAKANNCLSISYTYTEPTIFLETALPIMKLAHEHNLKNIWVSNGFMSQKCLDLILPHLDAINVDLKFFSDKKYKKMTGGNLQPVLDNLIFLKKNNIFVEVTTLIIPGETNVQGQIKGIAKFIKEKLGANTPWHISKFSPEISYKLLSKNSTSEKELNDAYDIGKNAGLKYVYLGNVAQDNRENTYCPECGTLNIERQGYIITRNDKNGLCQNCKQNLNIVG